MSRRLAIPGIELTSTHSDALRLTGVPPSMLVVGAGSSGVQVASMFHAFGTRVQLFEAGPRILPAEDEAVAAAVVGELRSSGVGVHERFGVITSFEKTPAGVRMHFRDGEHNASAEAAVVVVAAGWVADTAQLNLAVAAVSVDARGTIKVDEFLRTSAPHIFAAGDVTGRLMLVPSRTASWRPPTPSRARRFRCPVGSALPAASRTPSTRRWGSPRPRRARPTMS